MRAHAEAATRWTWLRCVETPETVRDSGVLRGDRRDTQQVIVAVGVGHAHLAEALRSGRAVGTHAASHVANASPARARITRAALDAHPCVAHAVAWDVSAVGIVDTAFAEIARATPARGPVGTVRVANTAHASIGETEWLEQRRAIRVLKASHAPPGGCVADLD